MIWLLALAAASGHPYRHSYQHHGQYHHVEREHHDRYDESDLTDYDITVNHKVDTIQDDDDRESLHDKMTTLEMDREGEPERVKDDLQAIKDYAILHEVDCDECKDPPEPEDDPEK